MDELNSKKDYEVGRGKPPPWSRFKKGQRSANPRGRPKGSKSATKIWERILDRPVGENVITAETNSREALFLKAFHDALKGKVDNFEKLGGMRVLKIEPEEPRDGGLPLVFTLKLEDDGPPERMWDWDDDDKLANDQRMGNGELN
jgi:hypothetical protein